MARAIVITSLLLVIGIGAVGVRLWLQQRTAAATEGVASRRPPVLVPQADGSLYDLRLHVAQLEERLAEQERASRLAREALAVLTQERDDLREEMEGLRQELERLQEELDLVVPPAAGAIPPPGAGGPGIPPPGALR